jgi:thioesterase domain-containing protein/acyl carrier protein
VPYGTPIQNARYHVLDGRMQPVPIGVAGDLYIGGACLAEGYLNRPDLTKAAFIADTLSSRPGDRLYKTGDLARYFEDGTLEFLGRADFQIKVRGFRVELGEVEAALTAQPGVREGVCAAPADVSGQRSLVAYPVAEPGVTLDTRAVRQGLAQSLPEFMVPSQYVVLPALPMSDNGKVDRKALPSPNAVRARAEMVLPRTEAERVMTSIWEDVLQTAPIGVTDNFFDIGGHSLLAVVLVSRIESRSGITIPLSRLLECPTIESLVSSIGQTGNDARECVVALKPGTSSRCLFLIHDGDGETLLYRNLAMRMPDDVPVYGVAPLSSGRLPMVHSSVRDMASHYVSEIRKYQPQGPYHLGGLCAGGVIAFEMARQLEQAGQSVGLLALMEAAPPHAKRRPLLELVERWARFSALAQDPATRGPRDLARRAGHKIANVATYEVRRVGSALRSALLVWVLRHRHNRPDSVWPAKLPVPSVREVYLDAAARYVPRAVSDAHAIVFRAGAAVGSERPLREILVEPHFGWQTLLDDTVQIVDVDGGHSTMLQEPHVAEVARHLCSTMQCGAENGAAGRTTAPAPTPAG